MMKTKSLCSCAVMLVAVGLRFAVGASSAQPPNQLPVQTPVPPPVQAQTPATPAVYDTRQLAGFTLKINREFIDQDPALLDRVLVQLHADLNEIEHLVPQPAAAALRDVTVWIELQGYNGMGHGGHGLCCHWSPSWLTANDLPAEKAGGVEIIKPIDYLTWRRDQPYMLFHEFAHAYHWRLAGRDDEIKQAYRAVMDKHLYDAVERNSIPVGQTTKAYAATNDHEYFAELSEAYFAVNDFYPYTRTQLKAHDPEGAALIERLWNLTGPQIAEARKDREPSPPKAAPPQAKTP